jgi:protocatechuate 3,4-dioxygenase beta subunit
MLYATEETNEMDHDDEPVGRILTRREVLALFGLAGTAALAACAPAATTPVPANTASPATEAATQAPATQAATETPAASFEAATSTAIAAEPTLAATSTTEEVAGGALPACVVSPAMTEGPYFVDDKLNRSDIRVNTVDGKVSEGAEFKMTLRVLQAGNNGCTPLQNAVVDIWHCDAQGVYSDVNDRSFSTVGQNFLRGQQVTDANGQVTFTTIYPGWYPGRATHIHFKVRSAASANQTYEFTSQLFFDDAFSNMVFSQAPYAKSGRHTLNTEDGIFMRSGGEVMKLDVKDAGGSYTSLFDIGMQI